jgi:aldose sugar dehydrogenase
MAKLSRHAPFPGFALALLTLFLLWPRFVIAQTVNDPNLTVTIHGSGFSSPTQLRFLGNNSNDYFVAEKDTGQVNRVLNGVTSVALNLNVANDSERGLLGLTLHPNFAVNNQVYLYYSATSGDADGGTWTDNRLERYLWNGTVLTSDPTFTTVTFGTSGDGFANGPNHDAGPILFGPDAKLYGTTGDLNRDLAEQNNTGVPASTTSAKVGGIYRLNDDGTVPSDNPFFGNANPEFRRWYAYGVRNTYGAAFDPANGNLWDTENGPANFDEINLVAPGFNSGWNEIMGPGSPVNLVSLGAAAAYSNPEFSFEDTVALTGIEFLADSALPASYDNAVVVGAANNGELYLFRLNATRDAFVLSGNLADLVADDATEDDAVTFGQGFVAITDIQVGPDGALYVVSIGDGNIYRIIPEPTSRSMFAIALAAIVRHRRRP